ncbi:MAG: S8 family serine peptidase [Solirubrobacteraceae bacterium]
MTGVLVTGKPSARAVGLIQAVGRPQRYTAGGLERIQGQLIARSELIVTLKQDATVGQVNALLTRFGGGITSSVRGSAVVLVGIPDPGSAQALQAVKQQIAQSPIVARVELSPMVETTVLPPGILSPPTASQQADLSHLLASGVVTAWNARAAANPAKIPTVVIADEYGGRKLSHANFPHLNATYEPVASDFTVGPKSVNGLTLPAKDHGYHVTGIIHGDFPATGGAAGLVTGVLPFRARLAALDVLDVGIKATSDALINELGRVSGHAVVNTSLALDPPDGFTAASRGFEWISDVRAAGNLEQRVVHATAAGNDAREASDESPWTAAALSTQFNDAHGRPVTLSPLTNTMVVENAVEGVDSASLTCLNPTSSIHGSIAAPGTHVYSFNGQGGAVNLNGTSMASPVIAGLAAYIWSIAPDLTPQQVIAAMRMNPQSPAPCSGPVAPLLDAYKAVLSLDQSGPPTSSGDPVRLAILDLNGDHTFTQADLQAWIPKIDPNRTATKRDWSREDLNGDGFTGGHGTGEFDLNRAGSQRAGTTSLTTVPLAPVQRVLDESRVTDADILCYYAYSPLYSGNPDTRTHLLDPVSGCKKPPTSTCSLTGSAAQADGTSFVEADPESGTVQHKESSSLPFKQTASAGSASATQDSKVTGSTSLTLDSTSDLSGSSLDFAYTGLTRRFTVTGNGVCVKLTGSLDDHHDPGGSHDSQQVSFSQVGGGNIFDFDDSNNPTFSRSAQLGAGTYQLDISGMCEPDDGQTCTAHLEAKLELTHK